MRGKKLFEVMNKLMDQERDRQRKIEQLDSLPNKGEENPKDGTCNNCKKHGHWSHNFT